ncbi:MAG TPA: hypothetical protein VFG46_02265 [Chryseolinea sp.]|nr:hypothetical protein [Chryseolinea sp.]
MLVQFDISGDQYLSSNDLGALRCLLIRQTACINQFDSNLDVWIALIYFEKKHNWRITPAIKKLLDTAAKM